MLYKKYHRNYIRQFKEGIKFSYKTYNNEICKDTVRREPFYNDIKDKSIRMTGKYGWTLVYCNGRVDYKIKIEENAV